MINSGSPVLSVAQLRARWLLSCLLPGAGAGGVSRAAADRAERGIGDIGAINVVMAASAAHLRRGDVTASNVALKLRRS